MAGTRNGKVRARPFTPEAGAPSAPAAPAGPALGNLVHDIREAAVEATTAARSARISANRLRTLREIGAAVIQRAGHHVSPDDIADAAHVIGERAAQMTDVLSADLLGGDAPWVRARITAHLSVPLSAHMWRAAGDGWHEPAARKLAETLAEVTVPGDLTADDSAWETAEDPDARERLFGISLLLPTIQAVAAFRARFRVDSFAPMGDLLSEEGRRLGGMVADLCSRLTPDGADEDARYMLRGALGRAVGQINGALHDEAAREALLALKSLSGPDRKVWVRRHPHGYDITPVQQRLELSVEGFARVLQSDPEVDPTGPAPVRTTPGAAVDPGIVL